MWLLGVKSKVSNRRTLSGWRFCFLKERLLSLFKFFASSNLLYFYQLRIGPQPTSIGQPCLTGPGYSSCTVRAPLHVPSSWTWSLLTPVYNPKSEICSALFFSCQPILELKQSCRKNPRAKIVVTCEYSCLSSFCVTGVILWHVPSNGKQCEVAVNARLW